MLSTLPIGPRSDMTKAQPFHVSAGIHCLPGTARSTAPSVGRSWLDYIMFAPSVVCAGLAVWQLDRLNTKVRGGCCFSCLCTRGPCKTALKAMCEETLRQTRLKL